MSVRIYKQSHAARCVKVATVAEIHSPRTTLVRAIAAGSIGEPGRYVVVGSYGGVCIFDVEERTQPSLQIV